MENNTEDRKIIEKVNKTKSRFRETDEKTHITKVRKEKENFTADLTERKRITVNAKDNFMPINDTT